MSNFIYHDWRITSIYRRLLPYLQRFPLFLVKEIKALEESSKSEFIGKLALQKIKEKDHIIFHCRLENLDQVHLTVKCCI